MAQTSASRAPALAGSHRSGETLPGDIAVEARCEPVRTRQRAAPCRERVQRHTVRTHLKSVFRKLDVIPQSDLIDWIDDQLRANSAA